MPTSTALRAGETVGGYRIDSEVTRGGMGVVYRATDLHLRRPVALKVIAEDLARDEAFRHRFIRESRVAASIRHPHVVTVFAAGEADGLLYIAMDYIDGIDLRSLLERDGRLEPPVATMILTHVAAALDAAHARTFVHRDVKPGNILVAAEQDGLHAFLTDFGLTKDASAISAVTQSGALLGTVDYMAPEQIRAAPVDGRADVYALGCVYYEMLTGRVPFDQGSLVAKLFAHLNEPVPRLRDTIPELPERLDHIVRRAMDKAPENRYDTAGEMARAAAAMTSGTVISPPRRDSSDPGLLVTGTPAPAGAAAPPDSVGGGTVSPLSEPGPGSPPPPAAAPGRRRWRWPAAAGAILLVLACIAGLLVRSGGEQPPLSKPDYQTAVIESNRPVGRLFAELIPKLPPRLTSSEAAMRAIDAWGQIRDSLDQGIARLVAIRPRPDAVRPHEYLIAVRREVHDSVVGAVEAAETGRREDYQAALRAFRRARARHIDVGREYRRAGYRRLADWTNCVSGDRQRCPLSPESP
jgi:serine/threonine-protein kinase